MTGMKEGAGEDPFADDDETTDTESIGQADTDETQTSSNTATETTDTQRPNQQQMQIPYKFRRDGVQDGRDRVPLFLQGDSKSAERDALREIEQRFDDDVSLTDLREALVKVGLQHLDEVEVHLEEWGYGMTFDE
jgi:hypothetical protein